MCCHLNILLAISIVINDFFFFKQKTAYEMRISDWSSDVCSSDLAAFDVGLGGFFVQSAPGADDGDTNTSDGLFVQTADGASRFPEIGRASCRERVCQYV